MQAFPCPTPHAVPLFLAPMAGVSEPPFRRVCRGFGADVVVSEFLSCEGLRRGIKSVHDGAYFTPPERPIGIQLYGADPAAMAEAATLVTESRLGPIPKWLDKLTEASMPNLGDRIAFRVVKTVEGVRPKSDE